MASRLIFLAVMVAALFGPAPACALEPGRHVEEYTVQH